ncbi:MAG: hypothetical protein M1832_005148 [Thelocarpon impressellum]|nr:MAG: hypothetical protein M1832_005148 [Thelocarpon impressellum]
MRRIPFFRIFYSTTFTVLSVVLAALLLITPADAIRQAIAGRHVYYVFYIAGTYLLTLVLALLIYASRLFTNRSVLAGIPKAWIPVEKGDVGTAVRRMIAESLARSALITREATPRRLPPDGVELCGHGARRPAQGLFIDVRPDHPPWGRVGHAGWSSPSTADLPNLQYRTVILELPNIIEAKAVALAHPDYVAEAAVSAVPAAVPEPDGRAMALLQRPAAMDLREYVGQLVSLGLLPRDDLAESFLAQYEHARFSDAELSEQRFRDLTRTFAEVLRCMSGQSFGLLNASDDDEGDGEDEDDGSATETSAPTDDADSGSTPTERSLTPRSRRSLTPSEGSIRARRTARRSVGPSQRSSRPSKRSSPRRRLQAEVPLSALPGRGTPTRSSSSGSFAASILRSRQHPQAQAAPASSAPSSSSASASPGSVIHLQGLSPRNYASTDLPSTLLAGGGIVV